MSAVVVHQSCCRAAALLLLPLLLHHPPQPLNVAGFTFRHARPPVLMPMLQVMHSDHILLLPP